MRASEQLKPEIMPRDLAGWSVRRMVLLGRERAICRKNGAGTVVFVHMDAGGWRVTRFRHGRQIGEIEVRRLPPKIAPRVSDEARRQARARRRQARARRRRSNV